MTWRVRAAGLMLGAFTLAPTAAAQSLELGLPIVCEFGKTCWVQQYFDHEPLSDVSDYACGSQSNDDHDGTDFRIRDTEADADVVAAAGGTVRAVRDSVPDRLIRSAEDSQAVTDRECGNGVAIVHDGGWETQYCHLRLGSVAVKAGDRVEAGQKLGKVGFSGNASFPHVEVIVRKDGTALDPFKPETGSPACGLSDKPLWTREAIAALGYSRSDVLRTGFAPGPVELKALEEGGLRDETPAADWPAMVAYVWLINLEAGDELRVTFDGPDGLDAENTAPIDRPKAQYLLFSGKKRPSGGWPKGEYTGTVEVRKDGVTRVSQSWKATIQ